MVGQTLVLPTGVTIVQAIGFFLNPASKRSNMSQELPGGHDLAETIEEFEVFLI